MSWQVGYSALKEPLRVLMRFSILTILSPGLFTVLACPTPGWAAEDIADLPPGDMEVTRALVESICADGQITDSDLIIFEDQLAAIRGEVVDQLADGARRRGADVCRVFLEYVVAHDPHPEIRTRAAASLSREGIASPASVPVLTKALSDSVANVRLFACQSLMFIGDSSAARDVLPLLDDENIGVRQVAARTLGWFGYTSAIPKIIALYDSYPGNEEIAWIAGDALARLGEKTTALRAIRAALHSSNWNIRHFAVLAIAYVDDSRAVTELMERLPAELKQTLAEMETQYVGDRVLQGMIGQLAKRTGQSWGGDIGAWQAWWADSASAYGVMLDTLPDPVDPDLVTKYLLVSAPEQCPALTQAQETVVVPPYMNLGIATFAPHAGDTMQVNLAIWNQGIQDIDVPDNKIHVMWWLSDQRGKRFLLPDITLPTALENTIAIDDDRNYHRISVRLPAVLPPGPYTLVARARAGSTVFLPRALPDLAITSRATLPALMYDTVTLTGQTLTATFHNRSSYPVEIGTDLLEGRDDSGAVHCIAYGRYRMGVSAAYIVLAPGQSYSLRVTLPDSLALDARQGKLVGAVRLNMVTSEGESPGDWIMLSAPRRYNPSVRIGVRGMGARN